MTARKFAEQLDRLKSTYGERNYPAERVAILHNAVKSQSDEWLESAVTHFIGNNRQAPMLKEFIDEIEDSKRRNLEYSRRGGSGSPVEVLKRVAVTAENKEFARFCVKALEEKLSGRITREQFFNEVMPMIDDTANRLCGGGDC